MLPRPSVPGVRRGTILSTLALTLTLAVAIAAVFGGLYFRSVHAPMREQARLSQQMLMRTAGLRDHPVANRLDARFADANSDLVADAPADPAAQADPDALQFCYIADEEAEATRQAWAPFVAHLSQMTGKPVEYAPFTNTRDQLLALREGKLHVTGLNTGSVPTAVNACGFVPVCVLPTDDGSGFSRMRLIVPPDSPIRATADLKGRELTLTDPGSNSGYKAALVVLKGDFDLVPGRDFTLRYSGGHNESIRAVADKRAVAAAVADDMLARALSAGGVKPEQYRSVYESEKFPTAGLGYANVLKPELAAKVREALASFDWKGTPLEAVLGSAGGTKFVPTAYKNDWGLIRRIDDAMGRAGQAIE